MAFEPGTVDEEQIVQQIKQVGYGVPTESTELLIRGMSCVNCAATIERILARKVPGVISVAVNFATERATVVFVAGQTTATALVRAIGDIGYGATPAGRQESPDAEQAARHAEIRKEWQKFLTGVTFAMPLFVLSMSRDFNLLGSWAHAAWVNWLMLLLATPVQFYVGWDYYVGGWKSVRNGTANMDVLIANLLGSLVVTALQQAAMSRADMAAPRRHDFWLCVDEFQNFATKSFASFRCSLIELDLT